MSAHTIGQGTPVGDGDALAKLDLSKLDKIDWDAEWQKEIAGAGAPAPVAQARTILERDPDLDPLQGLDEEEVTPPEEAPPEAPVEAPAEAPAVEAPVVATPVVADPWEGLTSLDEAESKMATLAPEVQGHIQKALGLARKDVATWESRVAAAEAAHKQATDVALADLGAARKTVVDFLEDLKKQGFVGDTAEFTKALDARLAEHLGLKDAHQNALAQANQEIARLAWNSFQRATPEFRTMDQDPSPSGYAARKLWAESVKKPALVESMPGQDLSEKLGALWGFVKQQSGWAPKAPAPKPAPAPAPVVAVAAPKPAPPVARRVAPAPKVSSPEEDFDREWLLWQRR